MSGWVVLISSNFLAIIAAVFGVLAALAASLSALQASRETAAAVSTAEAKASVAIDGQARQSALDIAEVNSSAQVKIAEAKKDAANANARAAVLEQETAHAKLRLAQIARGVGARQVTVEQRDLIVRALRGKVAASFIVDGVDGDPESSAYAFQIGQALEAAGMNPRTEPYPSQGLGTMSGPGNPIMMYAPPAQGAQTATFDDPVYQILMKVLGTMGWSPWVSGNQHPDYYFIQVGRKTAPDLHANISK